MMKNLIQENEQLYCKSIATEFNKFKDVLFNKKY